jgi:hypothetical protein
VRQGFERTRPGLLVAAEIAMEPVEEPAEKLERVALLCHLELAPARDRHFLEELVGGDLGLEQVWVPDLPRERGKALDKLCRLTLGLQQRVFGCEEKVADRRDVQEREDDDILVVVELDVVEADVAGDVWPAMEVVARSWAGTRARRSAALCTAGRARV